ncbi:hypothetical protein [Chitinimonas sp. BJB300]|uniref:hypothetical protein n=1 Tax=Chitinimonas sp. BJB300 TaxID=1559339 RepID=UPI000C0D1636|nr:hypothetical protein [Chitinimonas sp. BJB300]PHV12249.1 hypothetical protein CSQ89_06575 [Chitinimonas sp. BJB300]TSJ84761.1 hypothetical protein FG002_018585 [Chitinimonas sp. BJB300]
MANDQAVFIYLDGINLPEEIYEKFDVATLEEQLVKAIKTQGLGEFDGNEFGTTEVMLTLYGPSAEKLYAGIESIIARYPLCKGARVILRSGGPGSPERELRVRT